MLVREHPIFMLYLYKMVKNLPGTFILIRLGIIQTYNVQGDRATPDKARSLKYRLAKNIKNKAIGEKIGRLEAKILYKRNTKRYKYGAIERHLIKRDRLSTDWPKIQIGGDIVR